jgi:hypothetical protein
MICSAQVRFQRRHLSGAEVDPVHAGADRDAASRGKDDKLGELDLAPARDTIGGLSPEYLKRETARAYARDGQWVTAPDESGLALIYKDQAVRRADGKPLVLSWASSRQMGKRRDAWRRRLASAAAAVTIFTDGLRQSAGVNIHELGASLGESLGATPARRSRACRRCRSRTSASCRPRRARCRTSAAGAAEVTDLFTSSRDADRRRAAARQGSRPRAAAASAGDSPTIKTPALDIMLERARDEASARRRWRAGRQASSPARCRSAPRSWFRRWIR